jgi:hypothetical protein
MYWLYLVVAAIFILLANMAVTPMWVAVLLVLGSLVLFVAFVLAWMGQRISGASRDEVQMITPEEMRLLREQAEARRAAAAAAASAPDEPTG